MKSCCKFLCSSIGRKVLMAFTGMALSLFLVLHVLGNLVILTSPTKFNEYAFNLESMGPLLYAAEFGLIGIFLLHLIVALRLTLANKAARPESYCLVKNTGRSRRTWGSSHMFISGSAIFLFVIYHLKHFKFATHSPVVQKGIEMRDLAKTVIGEFKELDEIVIYVVALIILGMHLRHGFRSVFDTLGLAQTKWDSFFRWVACLYVYGVIGAFILIPLWIYFGSPA